MPNNRLDILRQMLEQDPASNFARYGLAMELVKDGQLDAALEQFQDLINRHPEYAAAYFHGGQTCEKAGKLDQARAMYLQGISVTTKTGDMHTRSELQAALDILG